MNYSHVRTFFALLCILATSQWDLEVTNYVHSDDYLPEASDIEIVGDFYYLIMDDYCFVTKVAVSGGAMSKIESPIPNCYDSDHEAIFRFPGDTNDVNPTFIVCGEDTLKCSKVELNGGPTYTITDYMLEDGGDGCHDGVNWGDNKGIEGAVGLFGPQGAIFMLALIEGTGRIITYQLETDKWVSKSCVDVPHNMRDYSSLAYYTTATETVFAVTSQKGEELWVGLSNGINQQGQLETPTSFSLQNGNNFDLDNDYEGVEGVIIEHFESNCGNMAGALSSDDQAGSGEYGNAVHKFTLTNLDCSATSEPTASTPEPSLGPGQTYEPSTQTAEPTSANTAEPTSADTSQTSKGSSLVFGLATFVASLLLL